MEKKLLFEEELQKFKKLSGIINEAGGPANWVSSLISKISKTALSDVVIKEFEPLVNAGKIAIDKSAKMVKSVNWSALTDDEVKLLFRSDEMVKIMDEVIKANGIKTTRAAMMGYKGNFKKIMDGYVAGKAEARITGSAGSHTTTASVNAGGKYTGNILQKLGNLFGNRIDDVTLQKLKDPNSALRLDLENELTQAVGREKSGLVKSAINKAVSRVSKITEGLDEQAAYNKVFETALTNIGIRKATSEQIQKYFGWLLRLPWWGQAIVYSMVLNEIVNPLLGTSYSLWGIIKYVFGSAKEGAIGAPKLDDALNRLRKSSEEGTTTKPEDKKNNNVTTY